MLSRAGFARIGLHTRARVRGKWRPTDVDPKALCSAGSRGSAANIAPSSAGRRNELISSDQPMSRRHRAACLPNPQFMLACQWEWLRVAVWIHRPTVRLHQNQFGRRLNFVHVACCCCYYQRLRFVCNPSKTRAATARASQPIVAAF